MKNCLTDKKHILHATLAFGLINKKTLPFGFVLPIGFIFVQVLFKQMNKALWTTLLPVYYCRTI